MNLSEEKILDAYCSGAEVAYKDCAALMDTLSDQTVEYGFSAEYAEAFKVVATKIRTKGAAVRQEMMDFTSSKRH